MRVATFFINAEISRLYNVSEPTVSKWLKAAEDHKNNLELTKTGGRYYVLDTVHNRNELRRLAQKGIKFRNKVNHQILTPNTALYQVFSSNQIVDLVTAIEDTSTIPLKYSYFGRGAKIWDEFTIKMHQNIEKEVNIDYYVYKSAKLLSASICHLLLLVASYSTINIVDVGTGNGQSITPVIEALLANGYKVNYTGIDISQTMLSIAENNLNSWFPAVSTKTDLADMEYMFIKEKLFGAKVKYPNSCNLIFFLGSTIGNVQDMERVLANFAGSMSQHDYFIVDNVLDTPNQRTQFMTSKNSAYEGILTWIPELLGFNYSMVEVQRKYDEKTQSRVQTLKLRRDIQIMFNLPEGRKGVDLFAGQEIQVWNHHSHTVGSLLAELGNAGMKLKYIATYPDQTHTLAITSK